MKSALWISLFLSALVSAQKVRPPCPTITSVTASCDACFHAECVAKTTLTQGCGCPKAVPTVYISRGCDQGCPKGCKWTSHVIATPTAGSC
ncbi:unnamed protein product [Clonostachys byssicola]|uniref:Uncharacterized protein n=1 Tax=Clonostachys byssicola TaxID=160290 RepID=A0A9N9U4Z9_9HYPO|nr:unnamed protein product [Clonostachys byssicola]